MTESPGTALVVDVVEVEPGVVAELLEFAPTEALSLVGATVLSIDGDPDTVATAELLEVDPYVADPLAGAVILSIDADPLANEGSGARYEHHQTDPATVWVVDHNLGRLPVAWSLFADGYGLCRDYVVELPTVNRLIVRADIPVAGLFRCVA